MPVRECKAATERSEFMSQYRSALFSRIVPTIKDIGLWGPRVRKAYADMGVLGFADTNVEELGRNDEEVALQFDERHRNVEEVAAVGREAIRYYIREGLLPEPERPARNVAWYDESFVEKIRFIKELQEKRYLPLNVIGRLLASDGDSSRAEVEALLDLDGKLFPQVEGSPKLEGERLVVVARRSRALGGNLEGWVQSGRGLPVRTDRSVRRHGGVART